MCLCIVLSAFYFVRLWYVCAWLRTCAFVRSVLQTVFVYLASADDTMENWDQNKLESVVEQRHAEGNKKANKTDIVSASILLEIMSERHRLCCVVLTAFDCLGVQILP